MNKFIKFSMALFLIFPGGLAAMEKPPEVGNVFFYPVNHQKVENPDLTVSNTLLEEMQRDEKEANKNFSRTLKWQNTLLTSEHWPVGLYMRDLIEGPRIVGDLAADIYLYKLLLKRRINSLQTLLLGQHEELIAVLSGVQHAEEQSERTYEELTPIARFNTSKELLMSAALFPLQAYIKTHHTLIGFNPFTKNTIIPIALRFLWQKVSNGIAGLLVDDTLDDRFCYAYKKDVKGKYVPIKKKIVNKEGKEEENYLFPPPLSVTNIANIVLNPARSSIANWFSAFGAIVRRCLQGPYRIELKPVLGIPSWISSSEGKFIQDLVGIAFSVQIFDHINSYYWSQYVVENREKLLDLLENYKQAISSTSKGAGEVPYWEQKIRKFILKGHTPASKMPGKMLRLWWDTLKAGQSKSLMYLSFIAFAGVCFRMLQVGHHLYNQYNSAAPIENESILNDSANF